MTTGTLPGSRTGTADLPLHGGQAPRWLFERMSRLAREIVLAVVQEYSPGEVVRRLADPFWFHSLGCLMGFDWHSSGLTTTTCGALKEGLRGLGAHLQHHPASSGFGLQDPGPVLPRMA